MAVAGMCRGAIEAACVDLVRAQKLAAGVLPESVERQLERASGGNVTAGTRPEALPAVADSMLKTPMPGLGSLWPRAYALLIRAEPVSVTGAAQPAH